jgi:hypothetical protein
MDRAPYVALEGVDGSTWVLSSDSANSNLFLAKGATGLDMLPWDVQVDEYPALDGEYPRAVRGLAREVFLPVTIQGKTRPEMVAVKRPFLRSLSLARFPAMAKLVVAEPLDGAGYEPEKEVAVYYEDGMKGDEGSENGLTWQKYGLVLRSAGSPFFTDRQDTIALFQYDVTLNNFFPAPGEPFLSPDGVSGGFELTEDAPSTNTISVTNTGDVGVYPTWEIVGPLTGPVSLSRAATSLSPAATLEITSLTLQAGESATLVTGPGMSRFTPSVGAAVGWSDLADNPVFWTLDPGENVVSVDGPSAGQAASQFSLRFRPNYLGV